MREDRFSSLVASDMVAASDTDMVPSGIVMVPSDLVATPLDLVPSDLVATPSDLVPSGITIASDLEDQAHSSASKSS